MRLSLRIMRPVSMLLWIGILVAFTELADASSFLEESCSRNATKSRKKRSLAFPKGSSFVLTLTLLKAIQVREPPNWNLDLEFDMIWPIPKSMDVRRKPSRKQRPFWNHKRHRRELYANFELALDSQGLPGNRCILRTLCEAKFILNPPGVSLIEDVLRVIFSYPSNDIGRNDVYADAALENYCDVAYPCPVSLLQLLLNYNNAVMKDR